MATVTTVTPTVTVRDHIPGIPDDGGGNIAGELDLNDIPAWSYLSSFVFPSTAQFTLDGTSLDIGAARIARKPGTGEQELILVDAETGISLNADTEHYVFFDSNNDYVIKDADEPTDADSLLVGTVDTTSGTFDDEKVRGRTPLPLPFLAPAQGAGSIAPIVTTQDADAIADTAARLPGKLDSLGGAPSVEVYFQYRQQGNSDWQETTKEAKSQSGDFDAQLSGLTAGTTYEYRAVALNPNVANLVGFGTTKQFTTTNDGTTNPVVETGAATNITASSADLNGELTDLGDDSGADRSSVDVFFEYRSLDGNTESSTGGQTLTATGTFSATPNGLTSSTTFEYRAAARASGETVYGDWVEFTTAAGTGLNVTTDSADNIDEDSANLNGTVTSFGQANSAGVNFNYRPQGDPTWDQTQIDTVTTTLSFVDTADQLVSGTTYEYQARASTPYDSATGAIETFTAEAAFYGVVDDYEDGSVTSPQLDGWGDYTGSTGNFSIESSNAISGSNSARLDPQSGRESVRTSYKGTSGKQASEAAWSMLATDNGIDNGHYVAVSIASSGGDTVGILFRCTSDGAAPTRVTRNGNTIDSIGQWSTNTGHACSIVFDWAGGTFDASASGIGSGSGYALPSNMNDVYTVILIARRSNTDGTDSLDGIYDDIEMIQ